MADYSAPFNQTTLSTAYKSAGAIVQGGRRLKLFELQIGQSGTPNATDSAVQWDVSRQTSSGTFSSVTPSPIDESDAACSATGYSNATAEPTYAAAGAGLSLWNLPINQRAAYREIFKDGKELVVSAVTSHGLGIRALVLTASGYASGGGGVLYFTE